MENYNRKNKLFLFFYKYLTDFFGSIYLFIAIYSIRENTNVFISFTEKSPKKVFVIYIKRKKTEVNYLHLCPVSMFYGVKKMSCGTIAWKSITEAAPQAIPNNRPTTTSVR